MGLVVGLEQDSAGHHHRQADKGVLFCLGLDQSRYTHLEEAVAVKPVHTFLSLVQLVSGD